jgi:hypothetical protein
MSFGALVLHSDFMSVCSKIADGVNRNGYGRGSAAPRGMYEGGSEASLESGRPCTAGSSETPTLLMIQRNEQRLPHFEALAVARPTFVQIAIRGEFRTSCEMVPIIFVGTAEGSPRIVMRKI